jgi:hypothetical protein
MLFLLLLVITASRSSCAFQLFCAVIITFAALAFPDPEQ